MTSAPLPRARTAAAAAPSAVDPAPDIAGSFWASLRYFNAYRIAVASLFLVATFLYPDGLRLGSQDPGLFRGVCIAYLALAIGFQAALRRVPTRFDLHLTVHVCTDIVATTLLMHASGGFRSGLAVMLLISLAAASLVSRGRLLLFFAAFASIAILLEQLWRAFRGDGALGDFLPPGLLSIGYFATALIASQLARRVIMNEQVARQRGVDLANQLRVNQLVIQDVDDGVMVVDEAGLVRQHNPRVAALLGRTVPGLAPIESYSRELAAALVRWREGEPTVGPILFAESGRRVRVRFVRPTGVQGGSLTVIYLEDLSKLEDQARQMKLAALGRLTANIAHEIRNPLAAITHAAELMLEENRAPARERLTRIIRDNAKRLDRMVQDVLELNRRDRLQPEPIRLGAALAAFLEEFAQNERVERDGFILDLQHDAVVEIDRVHLHQILWNLVRNAWRHSRQRAGSVELRLQRNGGRLELHVVDDGPGVPKELQGQLFEPFFTTFSGGTGLGLYIARELAAANGAALDYVDRPEGADFRIAWQGVPT